MRKVIVDEWIALDGVVQGPAYRDEDTDGGFERGGWHVPYFDEASMNWTLNNVTSAGGYVLGRRTYEIFAAYWPTAPEDERALAQPLNTRPKYVVSRTLNEPLDWPNSTLLKGDVVAAVAALRQQDGADLHVIGSTQLVQTLLNADLIDELRLMIDPVIVGDGKRLFRDGGALKKLRLVEDRVTTTGAILATFATVDHAPRAGDNAEAPSLSDLGGTSTKPDENREQ